MPKITVILPVYNPDPVFLMEALDSICMQSNSEIQVVISVDDNRTEHDLDKIFYRFAELLDMRIIFHNGTSGIFSNINFALGFAEGKYIQLFSQDDRMYPGFVQDQSAILDENPEIAMVFSAFDVIDSEGININRSVDFTFRPPLNTLISQKEVAGLFVKYGCLPGNISPVMLRREVIDKIGLFDPMLPYAGDFEYWVRLSFKNDLYYLHKPGLQVRKHSKQASMTISNRQLLLDLVKVYQRLLEHVPEVLLKSYRRKINHRTGTSFIHHATILVLKGKSPIGTLRERWNDLKQYPFSPYLAVTYYFLSIPSRVIRKILR